MTVIVEQDRFIIDELQGKPSYRVGYDLGFYVWQKNSTIHIRWTGDTNQSNYLNVVSFEISTDGNIADSKLFKFSPADSVIEQSESRIYGKTAVGPGEDGIDVTISGAETFKLDLQFSEPLSRNHWWSLSTEERKEFILETETEQDVSTVFFGENKENPDSLPASLDVQTENQLAIEPLSNGDSIEEFYGYQSDGHPHSHTPTNIEESNASLLFLWEEPNGETSLGIIHDDTNDNYGGEVTFQFSGLPADGEWVVMDDSPDSYSNTKARWGWVDNHTDGGAFRLGEGEFEFTITPSSFSGIQDWQVLSGDVDDPDRHSLDMSSPVTFQSNDLESFSAATLTLLPGYSEDSSKEDGDDLNSSMPDYNHKTLDAWFVADHTLSLPDDLGEATSMRKTLPEYPGQEFTQYRMKNEIEISFATKDSKTIDWSTVTIETNEGEDPPYVALEGQEEHGERNLLRYILEDEEMGEEWFSNENKKGARVKRMDASTVEEVNKVSINGVDGIRASAIYGGKDTFIVEMREKLLEMGEKEFLELIHKVIMDEELEIDWTTIPAFLVDTPTMYTFLEVAFFADGTKVTRVWDAGPYPKHYLYADGEKVDENDFEEDEGVLDTGEWEKNEFMNGRFALWVAQEKFGATPFGGTPRKKYEHEIKRGRYKLPQPLPIMKSYESGSTLDGESVYDHLDIFFPWKTAK